MSERRLVDTNVIVRHLVRDHAAFVTIADHLFAASDRRELTLVVLPVVLAECVFVLQSFYGFPRDRISQALSLLITGPGIEIDQRSIHLDALDGYSKTNLHFVDCVIAASAMAGGMAVASFDNGLKRLPSVKIDLDV